MKIIQILVLALSLIPLLACGKTEVEKGANAAVAKTDATPAPTLSVPKDGNYNSKGKITKINMSLGSVELDHEDIPGVMGPMLMEFFVRDKSQLAGLKVGDKVDFVLEYKNPAETIVGIKKTS